MKSCKEHGYKGYNGGTQKTCKICGKPLENLVAHTKKWYHDEWKINVEKLGIEPYLAENPYYKCASPMRLWLEFEVKDALEDYKRISDPKVILKGWTEEDKREYLRRCGYTDKQI